MRSSRKKDFSVFEFNEVDDEIAPSTIKIMSKLSMDRHIHFDKSPLTKYHFLQAFQDDLQQGKLGSTMCMDVHSSCESHKAKNFTSSTLEMSTEAISFKVDISAFNGRFDQGGKHDELDYSHTLLDSPSPSHCRAHNSQEAGSCLREQFLGKSGSGISLLELQSNVDELDVVSNNDENLRSSSTLHPGTEEESSPLSHSVADAPSNSCSGSHKEMLVETAVPFLPEFVAYEGKIFVQPQLTFFIDGIKLEGACSDGSGDSFYFEWAIDDLVHVSCQRLEIVGMSCCKLFLRLTADPGVEKGNKYSVTGIMKVHFAVSDPHWFEKEQKIILLSPVYKSTWNVPVPGLAPEVYEDMFDRQLYFTHFDELPEDVVYPKGDPDAVSISRRDIKLLEPETFINDTVIDFYIKFLKNRIPPHDKHKFHFFNSFFFRKLADFDKVQNNASEGRAAFQRVHKWTRKINLFVKDYIFIPINFSFHWSLIVICHPGEVAQFGNDDDDVEKASKVPCILHMDSIKGSHRGLKTLLQSYLWEEWKERYGDSPEEVALKFSNLRFVPLELPQQENLYDCGLFLLHYVELFLAEAPTSINPFNITKFSNFLAKDWFPPAEASFKRSIIRKLMYEILHGRVPEYPLAHCFSRRDEENLQKKLSQVNSPSNKNPDSGLVVALHDLSAQEKPREMNSGESCPPLATLQCSSFAEEDVGASICTYCSMSGRSRCGHGTEMQTCHTSSSDTGAVETPELYRSGLIPKQNDFSPCNKMSSGSLISTGGALDVCIRPPQEKDYNGRPSALSTKITCDGQGDLLSPSEGEATGVVEDSQGTSSPDLDSTMESKASDFPSICCQNFDVSSYYDVESLDDCDMISSLKLQFDNGADARLLNVTQKRRKVVPEGDKMRTRSSARDYNY